jgi:hypothetical protein
MPPSMHQIKKSKCFLLYNPTTVAFGKIEFKKKTWGRSLKRQLENHRSTAVSTDTISSTNVAQEKAE